VLDAITVVGWIVFIGMEIYAVYAAVQASKGRWNRYRICVRLIPGAEMTPGATAD
jgi:Na+/H+ antiporter NhaB